MDNTTQLFIRACKSQSTNYRLKRLYSSIYCGEYNHAHVKHILTKIVEEHQLTSITKLMCEIDTDSKWKYGVSDDANHNEHMIAVLASIIRLTEVSKLKGYKVPTRFRRKV